MKPRPRTGQECIDLWWCFGFAVVLLCLSDPAPVISQISAGPDLVAPLFITNAEFTSVLVIRNTTDNPINVLVTFDSLAGEQVGHRRVDVSPRSNVGINVDDVEMTKHEFTELGSIALSVTKASVDGVSGYVKIASRNRDVGVSVEEPFQVVGDNLRRPQVAFVRNPLSVPVVAVHSLSALPQSVSITCSDAKGRIYRSEVTLPARMTFLLNACISHKSEGRTYEQLLRGDRGSIKGALDIQIKGGETNGGIALWAFASVATQGGLTFQIAAIEFAEWVPPLGVLSPEF